MGTPEKEPRTYQKGQELFVTAKNAFAGRGSHPQNISRGTRICISEEDTGGSAIYCHVEVKAGRNAISPSDDYVRREVLDDCREAQERHDDTPLGSERTQVLRGSGSVEVRGTDTPQGVVDLMRRAFDKSGCK